MSFVDHEINMTGGGKEIGGLFVDSFELVGYLEDLDCCVDAGDNHGERIYWRHLDLLLRREHAGGAGCVENPV